MTDEQKIAAVEIALDGELRLEAVNRGVGSMSDVMQLVYVHLTQPVLEAARTLPPAELPRLLGDLAEVQATAQARLSVPAPAPAPSDELLNVSQAAAKLNCSKDTLYKRDFPFVRRLGRKRLFSSRGIDDYLARQK